MCRGDGISKQKITLRGWLLGGARHSCRVRGPPGHAREAEEMGRCRKQNGRACRMRLRA